MVSPQLETLVRLLASFALFIVLLVIISQGAIPTHASTQEARSLLKWKSSLQDQTQSTSSLSTWTLPPQNAIDSNVEAPSPCGWYGISCNLARIVIGINLTSSNIKSTINLFPFLILLCLTFVDLSSNELLGSIPPQVNLLTNLMYLDLSYNRLFGMIPWMIGELKKLEVLHLADNKLNGSIPDEIGQLHLLNELLLYTNQLDGCLPSSLGNLSSLVRIRLGDNSFSNSISLEMENLTNLEMMGLAYNFLTRPIPPNFGKLMKLRLLIVQNNELVGCIGTLESYFPIPLFYCLGIVYMLLHAYIKMKGVGDVSWDVTIKSIKVRDGCTPEDRGVTICNATKLTVLILSNNRLIGSLPQCLSNYSIKLSVLDLRMNYLSGIIPRIFSLRSSLRTLDLSQNQFRGTLPQFLINCRNLEVLDFGNNKIENNFPTWLGTLIELKVLILRSNKFKGRLDFRSVAHLFSKLHILDLSDNSFSGPLPVNLIVKLHGMMSIQIGQEPQDKPLYKRYVYDYMVYENSVKVILKGNEMLLMRILTIFTTFDLSLNNFEGNIPDVIGHLYSLIGLNLSHNHLTGSIPLTLGNLTNLEWLDLSSNKLSGRIPRELGDLTFLGYLDLSENQLTGRIPQDKQLSIFTSDSFHGNSGLYGTPLQNIGHDDAQAPPSPLSFFQEDNEKECARNWFDRKAVGIGYASRIVNGISIAYISWETGRSKWLVRNGRRMERRGAKWMKKPKRKAIKLHGGR
ncbi:hypothetical protein ACJRO7_031184 [Eucalyptus globulus]|uniref:Leucine-rich repeat-containing N-terminal plant-type domain-containing protein n=1 Tax=Eucalyptus globulus TaxID=34317 RepID=A0ABD3JGJ5_EUCGL